MPTHPVHCCHGEHSQLYTVIYTGHHHSHYSHHIICSVSLVILVTSECLEAIVFFEQKNFTVHTFISVQLRQWRVSTQHQFTKMLYLQQTNVSELKCHTHLLRSRYKVWLHPASKQAYRKDISSWSNMIQRIQRNKQ